MTHTFRRALPSDLPYILSVAREAYASKPIDWGAAEQWAASMLSNPNVLCLLGRRTVGFMLVVQTFWDPAPRAFLLPLFSTPGADLEPLALVREFAAHALHAGCVSLEGGSETGSDVGVLLQRLGAKPTPLHRLDFAET